MVFLPSMSTRETQVKLTDEELMSRFQSGEEKAFLELYERYQRRLYGYCVQMLKDGDLAHDLFQETFIRVSRKRHHFRGGNFSGWLFAIARNQCLNALRDRVTHASIDDIAEPSAPHKELYDETAEILRSAIETLPEEMKEALILRVYSGFSYQEIADLTDSKLATVKVRIHRAKLKLHDMLESYYTGGVVKSARVGDD